MYNNGVIMGHIRVKRGQSSMTILELSLN